MRTIAVLLLLATPASAQDALPGFAATYVCTGGSVVQVAYLNPPGVPSLAVVAYGGALIPMQQGPSASGVRYIAFDEQVSYRWHTKGDEGRLLFLAADHTAEEETILDGCRRVEG